MDNKSKDVLSQASSLLTIGDVFLSLLSFCIARLASLPTMYSVLIGGGTMILLVAFFSIFPKIRKSFSVYLLERWRFVTAPKRDKTIKNKIVTYTYDSMEKLSLQVSYGVKFHGGTHDSLEDKCAWTAGDVCQVEPIIAGQTIRMIPRSDKNDIQTFVGYQYFELQFHKTYSSHDGFIDTGFLMPNLYDNEHKAKTCLVSGIYDKTDGLTLRLRFASNLHVENVRKLSYVDYLDEEPYQNDKGTLQIDEKDSNYHCVEFTIPCPIFGGKYAIDWDFVQK